MAVSNKGSNTVSVLLGNGDGTFQPSVPYDVNGVSPIAVQVGAFNTNNDHNSDIVTMNVGAAANVSVLLGNGDGTFSKPAKATSLPTGTLPIGYAVGDFNKDGKLDIAVITNPSINVYNAQLMLGNGDGTFALQSQTNSTGTIAAATSIQSYDLNNDGDMDLLTTNSDGSVSVLLGSGNGFFRSAVLTTKIASTLGSSVIADFNGDGKPDVAVADPATGLVYLLPGNGDGTFNVQPAFSGPAGAQVAAWGNLTAAPPPGKADLVVTGSNGAVWIFLSNGDGTFTLGQSFVTAGTPSGVAVGAYNGDSVPGLAIANQGTSSSATVPDIVSIVSGYGDGTFAVAPPFTTTADPTNAVSSLATADFNNDGRPDLAAGFSPATAGNPDGVGVLFSIPGFGFGQPITTGVASTSTGSTWEASGDFNGDGLPDVALSVDGTGSIAVLPGAPDIDGHGSGTFLTEIDAGSNLDGPIVSGDFNGDGKLDLVAVESGTNDVAVLLGNGDGAFQTALISSLGSAVTSMALGDLNNDGKLDLAVTTTAGVWVLLGNGDGSFQAAVNLPSTASTFVAAADLNNDGKVDLVIANSATNSVSVLLGNGDGTFNTAVPINATKFNAPSYVAVADYNLDRSPDVAVLNSGWNDIVLLLNAGNGTSYTASALFGTGGSGKLIAADYNVDGAPDLAVIDGLPASAGVTTVSVLLNHTSGAAATVTPSLVAFGDVQVGQAAAPLNVVLSNGGLSDLTVNAITVSGSSDFGQTNNCANSTILAGANCTITVNFTPSTGGTQTAAIQIVDSAFDSPQKVVVTGAGASLTVAPTMLAFGNVAVNGGPSAPQSVTLTNTGTIAFGFGFAQLSDNVNYAQSNTCPTTLDPGASCTFTVQFQPTVAGSLNATMTLFNKVSESTNIVTLTGTGVLPIVTASPSSLSFGTVAVGSQATAQNITVSNTGSVPAQIGNATLTNSDDFAITQNGCGGPLNAGSSCTITVNFEPQNAGGRSGTLTIEDNAAGGLQSVALSGTGLSITDPLAFKVSGPSSKSVKAGQTADFTMTIGGQGFSGTAAITCIGAPQGATCNVPASVTVSATSTSTVSVSVTTTGGATGTVQLFRDSTWMWAIGVFGVVMLPNIRRKRRKRRAGVLGLLLLLGMCGCGGGSSSNSSGGNGGGSGESTPSGTYTISVRAQAPQATTDTLTLTLIVQ